MIIAGKGNEMIINNLRAHLGLSLVKHEPNRVLFLYFMWVPSLWIYMEYSQGLKRLLKSSVAFKQY